MRHFDTRNLDTIQRRIALLSVLQMSSKTKKLSAIPEFGRNGFVDCLSHLKLNGASYSGSSVGFRTRKDSNRSLYTTDAQFQAIRHAIVAIQCLWALYKSYKTNSTTHTTIHFTLSATSKYV